MPAMLGADCHFHVFDPSRYAYQAGAAYLPHPSQEGTPEQLLSVLDAHGLSHGLIVSAGPYGTDTRCLLDAIATQFGPYMRVYLKLGAVRIYVFVQLLIIVTLDVVQNDLAF